MLCYLRPFADRRLSFIGRVSYTMANYGWCIGMLLWLLVSYVMIGWITFEVYTYMCIYASSPLRDYSDAIPQKYASEFTLYTNTLNNIILLRDDIIM